jgi:hypothetical protein
VSAAGSRRRIGVSAAGSGGGGAGSGPLLGAASGGVLLGAASIGVAGVVSGTVAVPASALAAGERYARVEAAERVMRGGLQQFGRDRVARDLPGSSAAGSLPPLCTVIAKKTPKVGLSPGEVWRPQPTPDAHNAGQALAAGADRRLDVSSISDRFAGQRFSCCSLRRGCRLPAMLRRPKVGCRLQGRRALNNLRYAARAWRVFHHSLSLAHFSLITPGRLGPLARR